MKKELVLESGLVAIIDDVSKDIKLVVPDYTEILTNYHELKELISKIELEGNY